MNKFKNICTCNWVPNVCILNLNLHIFSCIKWSNACKLIFNVCKIFITIHSVNTLLFKIAAVIYNFRPPPTQCRTTQVKQMICLFYVVLFSNYLPRCSLQYKATANEKEIKSKLAKSLDKLSNWLVTLQSKLDNVLIVLFCFKIQYGRYTYSHFSCCLFCFYMTTILIFLFSVSVS